MMRRTVVAVEGGLYSNYRMFREYMDEALRDILGEDVARQVVIKAMEDGSSIGSALLLASSHSVIKAMEDGSSIGSALLLASSHSVRTISNI
ncbi:hypothetical protein F2Q68_00003649 [Brassica cretica]|uniref:Phosphotransferase n=1 Tax=Brassica cretica TaxID=69181 RepID=A0A8S9J9M0_BRACR|nr:hypothetical protein F2Q68_00003649 [Brassica cretica]